MADSVRVDGPKIEHLRKVRAGMNRKEMATVLGITPAAIYMIERSRQTTRPATLKRIAVLLGEKPEDLAAGQAGTNGLPEARSPERPSAMRGSTSETR